MLTIELMSAQDASTDKTSPGYQKGDLTTYSVQFVFSSATLGGDVSLNCSNDGENWVQVADSSLTVVAGASAIINVTNAGYKWVQAAWEPTGGTGTVTCTLTLCQPVNRY